VATSRAPRAAEQAAGVATQPPQALPAPPGKLLPDIRARFRDSNDYLEFAASVYEAAKQGDGAAQYYLHRALNFCEGAYGHYFIVHLPRGEVRNRTLEEALQLTAMDSTFTPGEVGIMQTRCEKLMAATPPPYGSSSEWLEAAGKIGYPPAVVEMATRKSVEQLGARNSETAQSAAADIRRSVVEAMRSRDPQAIVQVGDLAAVLSGGNPHRAMIKQWTWELAACGDDPVCHVLDDQSRFLCRADPQCQPFETPVDIIRRQTGNDFDEIERAARELREKIDTGTIEESDI
jgi:hypothetical protein